MASDFDPTIAARLVELIVLGKDDGRTVEQLAIADLGAGRLIAIFDSPALVSGDLVGKVCEFRLSAFLPKVRTAALGQYSVRSWTRSKPISIHNPGLSGKVLGYENNHMVLEVQGGSIRAFIEPGDRVEIGSFVLLSDFRLDRRGEVIPLR